jgi:hypothetical protein
VYIVVHAFGFLSIPCYQRGFMTVTTFHAVQYLSIVWLFENRQESTATLTKKVIKLVPGVYSFFLFWILLYFIGDAIQSHVFTMGDALWMKFSSICLAAISAHHYMVDTVLWGRKAGI